MRKPAAARDTAWLASTDVVCVLVALVGQVILAKSLLASEYGLMIIVLDAFATLLLLVDAGLPTVLLRDGPKALGAVRKAGHRILKLQALIAIPFLAIGIIGGLIIWDDAIPLVLASAAIAAVHIASYTHRAMLRIHGEARLEGITKLLERVVTVGGYACLFYMGSDSVLYFVLAFLVGAVVGLVTAVILAEQFSSDSTDELGGIWKSDKSLLLGALPFAVTLGILPYVTRIEKFLLAFFESYEEVALYHVAQLAWLAGLTVPHAMRSALLPVFGGAEELEREVESTRKLTLLITPIGFTLGALLIWLLIPIAFPSEYSDGSLGANASALFMILLSGWAMTMLCVPQYTKLQAGENPWRFTLLLLIVVTAATISGLLLIPTIGLIGAAWASVIGSAAMFYFSHIMSESRFNKTSVLLAFASVLCSLILYDFFK